MKDKDGEHRQRWAEETRLTKLFGFSLMWLLVEWPILSLPLLICPHRSDCFKRQNQQSIQKHDTTTYHFTEALSISFYDYISLGKLPEADPYTLQPQTVIINNCISEKAKCLTMTLEDIGI